MRFLLALLLALIVACTASSDVRMHPAETHASQARYESVLIDDGFEAPDQRAIAGAVADWNATLSGAIVLEPHVVNMSLTESAILIMRLSSDADFIPPAREGEHILAFTDRIGGRKVWLVKDRLPLEAVKGVTMHELGHVLGADDRRDVEGLMFIPTGPLQWGCVDRATALEVAHAQSLPLAALAYCERVPLAPARYTPEDELTAYPPLRL